MAAPYRIYLRDYAAQSTNVTASHNVPDAINLVYVDQTLLWLPGNAGPNVSWSCQLTSSASILAVGFGNCQLVEGETIQIWEGSTLGAETTLHKTISAAPAHRNWLAKFTANTMQFVKIKFTTSTSTQMQIGSISVLGETAGTELLEFSSGTGPLRRSLNRSVQPGVLVTRLAGGGGVYQRVNGANNVYSYAFANLNATAGDAYDDLLDSLHDGWSEGAWITDDGFDEATGLGRAVYCRAMTEGAAQGSINNAGPQGQVSILVEALNEGVRV